MVEHANEQSSRWGRTALYIVALVAGLCGSGVVGHVFRLADQVQNALIIAGLLLAFLAVRASRRANAHAGNVSSALQRYYARVIRWSFAYLGLLIAANWYQDTMHPAGPQLWLLALIKALPIVYLVWQNGRYLIEETDEYLKAQRVFALLVGTGLVLVVTPLWGSLADAGAVPHIGTVWIFPLWMTGVGIGVLINLWRAP